MENKLKKGLDEIYDLLNVACGNCIIEENERDNLQEIICYIEKQYEQLEKENKELKEKTQIISPYYVSQNYIPKSKIKEKIKELKTNLSSVKQINESIARFTTIQKLDYQIQILEELRLGGIEYGRNAFNRYFK